MLADIRYRVSRLVPEKIKFNLSLGAGNLAFFFLKALKGIDPRWQYDEQFLRAFAIAKPRILLDPGRAFVIYQTAVRQRNVPGDYVELGAYQCGTAPLLSNNNSLKGKTIVFIDSFQGLPAVSEHDRFWEKGDMGNVELAEIENFLSGHLTTTAFKLVKGFFPQDVDISTLPDVISLLHIDTDLYQPTKDALELLYERLAPGGVVIIDDYSNMSCPGVTEAVDQFAKNSGVQPLFLITGQALIIKV